MLVAIKPAPSQFRQTCRSSQILGTRHPLMLAQANQDMDEMMPAIFTIIVGSAFMTLIVKSISEDAMNK